MMGKVRILALLAGPLVLGAVMSTPAEACWLFGCGGRAAYRPVYASYGFRGYAGYGGCGYGGCGVTSNYAPYSYGGSYGNCGSCGYGGYSGYSNCNSCSSGNCGVSYYGGYSGYDSCCNPCSSCGGPCDLYGQCNNCQGGNCQLNSPTNPTAVNPDPNAAQPKGTYNDQDTRSGDSQPTFRNSPPPNDRTAPAEEDPRNGVAPMDPLPEEGQAPGFRGTRSDKPVTETPVNPAPMNVTPEAPNPDAASNNPAESKDGAGFLDDVEKAKFRAPDRPINVDDKVAWSPAATRTRLTVKPAARTARLVRSAAYPNYAWIPSVDPTHVAKK